MKYYIGIDLGGTNTKLGLVNEKGDILANKIIKTLSKNGITDTVNRICTEIDEIRESLKIEKALIEGIGIGIPGPVKNQSVVKFFSNFDWEENINLKEIFENKTGIITKVENDGNVIAQAEAIFGAAKNYSSSITIAIGTGIGGGLFLNGKIFSGVSGCAGEVGHMKIAKEGKKCGCGQHGCFEAYASATSLIKEAKNRMLEEKNNLLYKKFSDNMDTLEAKDIFETAKLGDDFSKSLIEYEAEYLAMGIGSLVNIINPDIIVICGGISLAGDQLLNPLKNNLKKYAMPPTLENLNIVLGMLGNEAGIKGAAALFF